MNKIKSMFGGVALMIVLLLGIVTSFSLTERRRDKDDDDDDPERNKAILEMLHIDKVSVRHQVKPHPYMTRVYQHLDSLEAEDFGRTDGTLVQSLRSVDGPDEAPPGWIWFNVSTASPSMLAAELVLFRKTLHPYPLSVTVTLHSVTASWVGALHEGPDVEERPLSLDRRPESGFDVFDVSAVVAAKPLDVVGFQLRYKDESGSLVLHEALTQSLYCLDRGDMSEPLLVLYQGHTVHI